MKARLSPAQQRFLVEMLPFCGVRPWRRSDRTVAVLLRLGLVYRDSSVLGNRELVHLNEAGRAEALRLKRGRRSGPR